MAKSTPKSSKKDSKAHKPAAKHAQPKKEAKASVKKAPPKPVAKVQAKPAPKSVPKKEEKKPTVVSKAPAKVAAKKPEVKEVKKSAPVEPPKKIKTPEKVTPAPAVTAAAKKDKTAGKKKPTGKKEEFELEDDLVGEGDDFANDELSEYQAELESAEEEVEEKEVAVEEAPVVVAPPSANKEKGDDVILTDAEGRRYCRVKDCDQVATVDGYCRYHYLLLWKKIQVRKKILTDGKLERYIEELTSRYPDKFLEVIRRDLRTEKDFVSAIQEMEIDESGSDNDFEDESSNFIEEVRGASPEGIVEDEDY